MLHSSDRTLLIKVVFSLLVFIPTAALAEVSDKEPSILHVWIVGVAASVVCFVGSYHRQWLVPVLAALPSLWFASLLIEFHSADIGPYLYAEQGIPYFIQTYLSLTTFVSGVVLGLLKNKRRSNF
jgi:hypothetical protein